MKPAVAFALCLTVCGASRLLSSTDEALSGGDGTVFDASRNAFSLPARNLREEHRSSFFVGNSFFNQNWVVAPASVAGRDGLGPLFNARSCSGCHFKDGRGRPPEPGEPMDTMLVRISVRAPMRTARRNRSRSTAIRFRVSRSPAWFAKPTLVSYEETAGVRRRRGGRCARRRIDSPISATVLSQPLLVSPRVRPR
jgi:hypothetical protein